MSIRVGNRLIGAGQPVFIIAEAGVNHNGDLDTALQLINMAVEAGADAIKFQTFHPESLASSSAPKAQYQITDDGRSSQLEMLQGLCLPLESWRYLSCCAQDRGIEFLSTPFDNGSADLLAQLEMSAFKLSSGDLTNMPLISHVAAFKRPVIMSTGMATLGEVETAIACVTSNGNENIILMHCTSEYPAPVEDVNLRCLYTLGRSFPYPVGYSDHTEGLEIAVAAAAMGAVIIEKHVTLDKQQPGPDQAMSLEPAEFKQLVDMIRRVELALGSGIKKPAAGEITMRSVARRSLVVTRYVAKGENIVRERLAVKRPGTGIEPALIDIVVGRTALIDIEPDTPLTWDMI